MRCTGLSVAALLAAGASAKVIVVEVGKSGDTFSPDTITASKGDIIDFHFDASHDVVAGDFSKPCEAASSGGFYSGMLPDGNKKYFSVTVNNTDPIFFYCSVGDHCQEGMVGVINEGTNKLSSYKSAAAKTSKSSTPSNSYNGTVSTSEATSSSSTATGTSKSSSTATSSGSASSATTSNAAGQLSGLAGASYLGLVVAGALAL